MTTRPQLDLAFARDEAGRSRLTRRFLRYPWSFTRPFWIDCAPAGMASVIPQSTSSVILAEDRLRHRISVGAGAAAHLTSQGAQAVHANPTAAPAEVAWTLEAAAGALLEVIMDPLVLFDGAWLRQRLELSVAPDAVLLCAEGVAWHSSLRRPDFRCFDSVLTARRPDGTLLLRDRARIDPAGLALAQAADGIALQAIGQLWIFAPPQPGLREALHTCREGPYTGLTELPNEAGYLVRSACRDAGDLSNLHRSLWRQLRRSLFGQEPPDRRKGP